MIEHTVQHDPDPGPVQCVADLLKIFVGSQSHIDLTIISGIVTMSIRFEYRGEIYRVHSQLLHMGDPLLHTFDLMSLYSVIFKRNSAESHRIDLIKNTFISPHISHHSFLP